MKRLLGVRGEKSLISGLGHPADKKGLFGKSGALLSEKANEKRGSQN